MFDAIDVVKVAAIVVWFNLYYTICIKMKINKFDAMNFVSYFLLFKCCS
jgi:hypothetical protein